MEFVTNTREGTETRKSRREGRGKKDEGHERKGKGWSNEGVGGPVLLQVKADGNKQTVTTVRAVVKWLAMDFSHSFVGFRD